MNIKCGHCLYTIYIAGNESVGIYLLDDFNVELLCPICRCIMKLEEVERKKYKDNGFF